MSAQELGKRFAILTKGEETENLREDRYQGAKFPDPEFMNTIRSATGQFSPDIVIIDPPFAVVTWRIRGTAGDRTIEAQGCSIFEINAEGKIRRYWLYGDPAQFASIFASGS